MSIRSVTGDDGPALRRFSARLSAEARSYLKEDVDDELAAEALASGERAGALVSVDDEGEIDAMAVSVVGIGRRGHVAELRVVVDPERRQRGTGTAIAREAILAALRRECTKVTVEVDATQTGTIDLFRRLGFSPEALLRDELQSDDGQLVDLVLLALFVDADEEGDVADEVFDRTTTP